MGLDIVLRPNERSGVPRGLEAVGNDQSDRLAVEQDSVGVQRAERVARRCNLVAPLPVQPSCLPAVLMGEDADDAGEGGGLVDVQFRDTTGRDRSGNDHSV